MFHKKQLQKKLLQNVQDMNTAGAADEDLTLKEIVDEASRQWKEHDPDGTNKLLARFFEMKDDILERAAKEPLTIQALMELEDVDFFEAIYDRVLAKEYRDMNEAERLFYLISMFDMEIQNGGLCQYFTNTEPEELRQLSDALHALGAAEHRALFEKFIADNRINLQKPKGFRVRSQLGYWMLLKKYPFDAFDDAYMQLQPLQDILTAYARTNIERFS